MFESGQSVWCVLWGKGEVESVGNSEYETYPVCVLFETGDHEYYTEDGRYQERAGRTLFFSEPKIEAAEKPLFTPRLKAGDFVVLINKLPGHSHIAVKVFEETETVIRGYDGSNGCSLHGWIKSHYEILKADGIPMY